MHIDPAHFLVGNNCAASHCNRLLGVPHCTPFAWSFVTTDDFARLADNWYSIHWEVEPEIRRLEGKEDVYKYYGGEFNDGADQTYWECVWHDGDGVEYPVLCPHLDLGIRKGMDAVKRRTGRMLELMAGGASPHFCLVCDVSSTAKLWSVDKVREFRKRDDATVVWYGDTPYLRSEFVAVHSLIPKLEERGIVHA